MCISRIAVFEKPGIEISIASIPIPPLRPGEILVKIDYVTLCQSDLHTYSGKRREKSPTILGHEISGHIAAFYQDRQPTDLRGQTLRIGDRVTWAIYASDPADEMAKSGIPQKAAGLCKYGHEKISATHTLHGGLADYIVLRPHTPVVRFADKIPDRVAAMMNCAVATIAGSLRLAGGIEGKKVLISGTGLMGLIAAAMVRAGGASQIGAIDIDESRLTRASDFGVDRCYLLPASAFPYASVDMRPDVVIELSGMPEAMEGTLQKLAVGGAAVWVGAVFPQRDLQINAEQVLRNLWSIRGLHNYNRIDLINAVTFMEQHHEDFPFADLVYDGFSLEEVNDAFEYAIARKPYRVGLRI